MFNVLAHNRDDHAKNFSFLMDHNGEWKLAPGYDLTFSTGPNGEQSTMVMGEGRNPNISHLTKLGLGSKLSKKLIDDIIDQTKSSLANFTALAQHHNIANSNIKRIASAINDIAD